MSRLLTHCSKIPETYNKISNLLYKNFQIQSAELTLLCTYIVDVYNKEVEHE